MFDRNLKKNSIDWNMTFSSRHGGLRLPHLVKHMTVCQSEIFTGRLRYSQAFFASISGGEIVQMRKSKALSMQDVLYVLTILGTFDIIARTGQVDIREPGFWVRHPYRDNHILKGSPLRPILPLDNLIAITGYDAIDMAQILRLLFEDEAIKILRNPSGVDGILLQDGMINMARFKHALRV